MLRRSSILYTAGTFLSRITGLIRDMTLASVFGASVILDAFLIAFRIPNLFRDMLAEGALGNAFTKVYSSTSESSKEAASQLLSRIFSLSIIATILFTLVSIWLAPFLVDSLTMAQGYGEQSALFRKNAEVLSTILFPYLGLAIISSVLLGVLHQNGNFFFASIIPISLNLGFLLGALLFPSFLPNVWAEYLNVDFRSLCLSLGVLFGSISGIIVKIIFLVRSGLLICKWKRPLFSPHVREVFGLAVPGMLASMSGPINVFINSNFATSLGAGAVTYLNYSFRILQLPVGLFGVAVAVVALPALARSLKKSAGTINNRVKGEFYGSIELVIWLMVPSFIYIFLHSEAIIGILFYRGHFTLDDVHQTAKALSAYSLGMVGYGLIKVLHSLYYALERTKYIMLISLIGIGVNILLSLFLITSYGHVGLAMATAGTLVTTVILLLWGLRCYHIDLIKKLGKISYPVILACGCYLVVHFVINPIIGTIMESLDYFLVWLIHLVVDAFLFVVIIFAVAWLTTGFSPRHLMNNGFKK